MTERPLFTPFKGESHSLEIRLPPGQGIQAMSQNMIYMESGIEILAGGENPPEKTSAMLASNHPSITTFLNRGLTDLRLAFAAPYPGQVVALDLSKLGGKFLCQKDSFLLAELNIEIKTRFSMRLGNGFYSREDYCLLELQGEGQFFAQAGGVLIEKDLQAKETLLIQPGCLVALEPDIDRTFHLMSGLQDVQSDHAGQFVMRLIGPGKAYLQSLPFSRLADRLLALASFNQANTGRNDAGDGGDPYYNLLKRMGKV
jgi:uncharacterized protein (AIM24 family)